MKKVLLILSCLLLSVGLIYSQTTTVNGVVLDDAGIEVVGASVVVKGTTTGVATDIDGKFSLNVPSNSTLVFSLIGMKKTEAKATPNMKVTMESDEAMLDEVVVTGYGVTKKAAFTGAASTLGEGKISKRNDVNVIKSLEGSVPGLQMNIASGQPGAPASIYIRGRNSINSGTQPLYVIDGIPISTDVVGTRKSEGKEISPLSTLSSSDIESMTVLKDATATSIYGARAANGVIVITTKRGKAGRTSVNFSAKMGFEKRPSQNSRYKLTNAAQNAELSAEAFLNNYKELGEESTTHYFNIEKGWNLPYTQEGMKEYHKKFITDTDPRFGTGYDYNSDTNWYDEVTRTGFYQEYGIDVQGGASLATSPKYFVSFNYLDQEAMVIGKGVERYSFRFNFDHSPTKFVKYGINMNLSLTDVSMGAGGGYFSDPITLAYQNNPFAPVRLPNGEWNLSDTGSGENPVAQRSKLGDKDTSKQYRAIVSPYLQLNITDKITAMSKVGLDFYYVDEFGYWSFLSSQGRDMRGMGENTNTTRNLLTVTNTINYIDVFDQAHTLNVLVGQEGQKTMLKNAYLSGTNFPVDHLNQVTNASIPSDASTYKRDLVLNSFFANAQYDYLAKYYLSGSFRYDGSSRFGKNNKWASFWSLGAKYRLTGESFMESTNTWLNDLTVRTSYGTTGNQEVGDLEQAGGWFAARDLYDFGYNYNGLPGSGHMQFGNPDLKWEKTKKFNVGIDIALLKIFRVEVDYYDHETSDMVFKVPVSYFTGLSSYYRNIGELSNRGFELSLSADVINNADLKWNVSVSGSKNTNKVKKLSTDLSIETALQITEVGRPIYQFKMKEWAGVDPETGNGLWYLNDEGDETTANYNAAAKRYFGSANPGFMGSFGTTLEWKGFDLGMQFNFSTGGQVYGNNLHYDENVGSGWGNNYTMYVYDNRWQKPGDITDVPRLRAFDMDSENEASSRFLMDSDYLKIRSLSLGYTLPKDFIKAAYMNNARVFVNAENLYTFTKSNYRGFDPSGVDARGSQFWNYPSPTTVVFGVSLGF